jgi:chromosome partitioning protein
MPERAICSACDKSFSVRFTYQREPKDDGTTRYYCSIPCKTPRSESASVCSVCGAPFSLRFAYQIATVSGERKLACSEACRNELVGRAAPKREPRIIAVLNQKGGTGKTTTAVSVAAGLAERGKPTLLVDLDAQGNVAVWFGVTAEKNLYHVLIEGAPPKDAVVAVRRDLDVLTCDQAMAVAELELAVAKDRARVLARRLRPLLAEDRYDFVVLDCAPSLSLLNQNALTLAREVLIPVSCDYLALVGVKQILRTIRHVNDELLHPVEVLGVVPTFYDVRNKISKQAVDALSSYFRDKVFPPVRVNTRLEEAPSHDKTIFEYAPDSRGAEDYWSVVERVLANDPRRPAEATREVATHG